VKRKEREIDRYKWNTTCSIPSAVHLLRRDLVSALVDLRLKSTRILTVTRASDRDASAEDLLAGASKCGSHGALTHGASNADEVVLGDVAVVEDVLLLLLVADGLLEGLDDEGSGRGDDDDLSLTVLDEELAGDTEALPVLGGLGNVVTDLLGVQTKRTDLGGKSRTRGGLSTDNLHNNFLDFVVSTLGRHGYCLQIVQNKKKVERK